MGARPRRLRPLHGGRRLAQSRRRLPARAGADRRPLGRVACALTLPPPWRKRAGKVLRTPRPPAGAFRARGRRGERRGRRRPVGRRGQGQDRRLAVASAPTSSCASRAATTPATRWSSAARPTSCRCCRRASCARASSSVIGNGVVLDPWALRRRDRAARARRASRSRPTNLRIAENCPLILPLHRELDALREDAAGAGKIGTTGRGIGPAYEDKVGRRAIRVMRPRRPRRRSARKLDRLLRAPQRAARAASASRRSTAQRAARRARRDRAEACCPSPTPVWRVLDEARRAGKRILFEGAQGALLDVDHGTYPFVTSSNTVAGTGGHRLRHRARARSATCSASPRPTRRASARARSRPSWTTRSASGSASAATSSAPSPGRKRRCGWFDAVLVRQAVRGQRHHGIALTKLDVLDGFDDAQGLHRLRARRRDASTICRPQPARAGARRAGLRDDRGLDGIDRAARAAGPTCRRRRSSTSAASRS